MKGLMDAIFLINSIQEFKSIFAFCLLSLSDLNKVIFWKLR